MTRENISFSSSGAHCAGWFYSGGEGRRPAIVMAHGLGATKELRLDAYAERFASSGRHVLVFDYRHFGDSEGSPRQLLDIERQHADWHAAIAWMRGRPDVDECRIALWGTSLSGGHVLAVAARSPTLEAVIAQVPHVSGLTALRAAGLLQGIRLTLHGVIDLLRGTLGLPPHYILSSGEPGEAALITAPGESARYMRLIPPGLDFDRRVAARIALAVPWYSPGKYICRLKMPTLIQVGLEDVTTPAGPVIAACRGAPAVTLKTYECGHFDAYLPPLFERFISDQLAFLETVPEQGRVRKGAV